MPTVRQMRCSRHPHEVVVTLSDEEFAMLQEMAGGLGLSYVSYFRYLVHRAWQSNHKDIGKAEGAK